ncbi:MAG: translation initiation factor IF-2 [Actinomycetes bacterium]
MAKKRVHEIAKDHGLSSKEVLLRLQEAGFSVKAAASSVDEKTAAEVLKAPVPAPAAPEPTKPAAKKSQPTKAAGESSKSGSANAGPGKRRVVIDAQAARRPGPGGGSGPGGPGGGPGGPGGHGPPGRRPRRKGGRRRSFEEVFAETAPKIDDKPELVRINSGSTLKDVAEYLNVPVPELIKRLMGLGEMATLTQTLSDDVIGVLAAELDREIEIVHTSDEAADVPDFDDAAADLVARPPVVTIMGHVDHGKTSLLDAIRKTEVAAGEAGGITQHIGAYQVHHDDRVVTFLDTPGHQAFTAMRARGAQVTDIAIIVVAADDGVKPQTEEAVDHAKAAGVPMLVAINKIDKEGAQAERVRGEMAQLGLQPVDWGGDTEFVDVSAKSGEGLDALLETLIVMADIEELEANPSADASGTVIESRLDPGRGAVVTILIQRGTLRIGEAVAAGANWGRVRAMLDYTGKRVDQALPGEPVEVLGFDSVPDAGEHVSVFESDREARDFASERSHRLKTEALARRSGRKVSLEDIFASGLKELNIVLKADVAGSIEALQDEIAKLPQTEVHVNVIHSAVGGINESDIMLASASGAIVLGFNVRPVGDARRVAEQEAVEVLTYTVIYRALEDLRAGMQGLLEPEQVEQAAGTAEVRQIFKASKIGTIAGSYVTDGKIERGVSARLVRDGKIIYEGAVESLRRFNEDAREVSEGYECGIVLQDFADVKEGDIVEAYATKQIERQLA